MARIHNSVFNDFAQTAEEFRLDDEKRPERCRYARWVAERDGGVVAYAHHDQYAGIYDARKFTLEIGVDPNYVRQGIGSALYATVIDALRAFDPVSISTWCREDMPCYVRFLDHRGFLEKTRMWVSELDLAAYDPTPFQHYTREVLDQGVEIKSRAELAGDAELNRKLYDLWLEVRQDMPLPSGEQRSDIPFEEWLDHNDGPDRLDEGYFVAIADGQLVGTSELWRSLDQPDLLKTGLTGVRRAYRRRGIAIVLKLRALEFARAQPGIRRVMTDNDSTNRPMLAINERLGFAKHPAWVFYRADWGAAGVGR